MKKSLKVIASATLAFSLFASVAMAAETTTTTTTDATTTTAATTVKTSKDFKDLEGLDATVLAKIDAMLAKKYFEGTADDSFGIKENMTRAQFAKVLVLVAGIKVDDTVKTSSFEDVKADDSANGWAIPFIEAAKKAGLVDGKTDTTFDPGANVTLGEFATALVKGLGIKPDTTGTPWYADAIKQAVEKKLLPEGTDGSVFATRADLVVGAFQADAAIANIGKVSVTEAKAVGVYKVQVTFSKAVDTAVAKLALTKGTLAVGTSTTAPVWSEDKKTVTLTTDTRITEGDYTVTLSGLDAAAVEKTTATFKATDEQVSKIDFVNANDTIAYSKFATVKLKATNQYGEAVSLGTSSFTALVSGQTPTSFKKDDDGNLVITANVTGSGISQGNGIVPVTVYYNNSNITVSKNFKVGTVPILSKIEAGKVTYSNNGTSLVAADETASIALTLIDQYGNAIVKGQLQPVAPAAGGGTPVAEISASNINPVITPYEQKLSIVRTNNDYTDFFDDNDNARIKVKLTSKLDKSGDFTVNIYGGSSSATATISVGAGALATKVEFDTSAVVIAAGDNDVKVPLIVTDAAGNKLSNVDIANDDNKDRFNFTVTNGTASLITSGVDKGKVLLHFNATNTVGSKVYLSGQIQQSQTNTFVQTNIPVQDTRVAERITVTTEPAAKAIFGADDKVVYQLKDQYGKDISSVASDITNQSGQVSNYRIRVDVTRDSASFDTDATPKGAVTILPTVSGNTTTYYFKNTEFAEFNKGFDVTSTSGSVGKVTVKATVEKAPGALAGTLNYSDYSSSVTRSYEAIKSDTTLTYSLNTIGNLYAAIDKFTGNTAVTGGTTSDTLTAGADNSKFDKKIAVVAKDSSGATVKLPLNYIKSVSSSNPNVISYKTVTTSPDTTPDDVVQDGFVIGNKVGTATVTAVVYTNKGATLTLTQDVTVKDEAIAVDAIVAGKDSRDYLNVPAGGGTAVPFTFAYDYFTKDSDNQLKVTDQYGITYKNADIARYNSVLGVSYTVTANGGSVELNPVTGQIVNVGTGVKDFTITATAPNGKSVQVVVKVAN